MKPYSYQRVILYEFLLTNYCIALYFVSRVPWCVILWYSSVYLFPPLSVALYEVWGGSAWPPHDSSPHLATSTRRHLIQERERKTFYTNLASDFILFWTKRMAIPTVQTSCECFSSVTPVFTFVSVCHIIATTSCCSPRTLSASWQSVARDTPVWQHQQLATAGKTRLAVDRVWTLIYIEKEFVFVSISNRNLWTNWTLEFLDKLDFLMGMRTWIGFGT